MTTPDTEADAVFEGVARYCSLLSEPMRVKILHSICAGEKSVTEIVSLTAATQTNVSRHLNILYTAGVLSRTKRGSFVYYAVKDHLLTDFCRLVCINVIAARDPAPDIDQEARYLARGFEGANI